MKKTSIFTLLFLLNIIGNKIKAQDFETLLLAQDDAEKLTEAYLAPAFKGLIYSMNNGWYHTAKVHKKFGFDVTIGASASFIPSKEETFNLIELELSPNSQIVSTVITSPTIAGSSEETSETGEIRYIFSDGITDNSYNANFSLPGGIKDDLPVNAVPAPAVQIGFGLPFDMDVMLRYTPTVGVEDFKGNLFGLGVKKEITDWFRVLGRTPFHISLLGAYTNMGIDYNIGTSSLTNIAYENASAEFKLHSYTLQAIASFDLEFFSAYGGIGYNGGFTAVNMLGDYTMTYQSSIDNTSIEYTTTDPLSLNTNTGSINLTLGMRLSMGPFKLFGSYTLQHYSSANVGFAISIR